MHECKRTHASKVGVGFELFCLLLASERGTKIVCKQQEMERGISKALVATHLGVGSVTSWHVHGARLRGLCPEGDSSRDGSRRWRGSGQVP